MKGMMLAVGLLLHTYYLILVLVQLCWTAECCCGVALPVDVAACLCWFATLLDGWTGGRLLACF
jgi:hypothetical protein